MGISIISSLSCSLGCRRCHRQSCVPSGTSLLSAVPSVFAEQFFTVCFKYKDFVICSFSSSSLSINIINFYISNSCLPWEIRDLIDEKVNKTHLWVHHLEKALVNFFFFFLWYRTMQKFYIYIYTCEIFMCLYKSGISICFFFSWVLTQKYIVILFPCQ